MEYRTFKEETAKKLEELAGDGVSVMEHKVVKNNGTALDAISFHTDGCIASPTVYLEPYYSRGLSVEDAAGKIYRDYLESMGNIPHEADAILDYGAVKGRIVYRLVNYGMNSQMLGHMPHRRYIDLAVTYCVLFPDDGTGMEKTVQVTDSLMGQWGAGCDEIEERARENTPRLLEWQMDSIEGLLGQSMDMDMPESFHMGVSMYVLTNRKKIGGASCILYPGLLEKIAGKWGTDIVIIPSSIHELILLPAGGDIHADALAGMIREINGSVLAPAEVLSDHAYLYSAQEKCVVAA